MKYDQIMEKAQYQSENWEYWPVDITDVDVERNVVCFKQAGHEYQEGYVAFVIPQILGQLGLTGTYREFSKDNEFLQKAITRKLEARVTKRHKQTMLVVDTKKQVIMGYLTTKYQSLTNLQVLKSVDEGLIDESGSWINDTGMLIVLKSGEKQYIKTRDVKLKLGDPVEIDAFIRNSGNGWYALAAGLSVLRCVCTNQALGRATLLGTRQIHIQSVGDLLTIMFKMIDKVKDEIPGLVNRMQRAAIEAPNISLEAETFGKYLSKNHIPERYHGGVITAINTEPICVEGTNTNRWGVFNGITRFGTHQLMKTPYGTYDEQMDVFTAALEVIH